jgi:hypothetical protein
MPRTFHIAALPVLIVALNWSFAAAQEKKQKNKAPQPAPAADVSANDVVGDRNTQAATAKIDQRIAAGWAAANAQSSPGADDAEFLRRVYLDLAGRVPSVAEARQFLDDNAGDKRQRVVEHLLASPRYATHFTNVWSALLLPEANNNFQARFLVPGFKAWLHEQFARNASYDKLVRELLTVSIERPDNRGFYYGSAQPNPQAFYLAKEASPENLASATARVFMGIRLECAQCHNHPFASWKREQFWSYAAFFAGIQRQNRGDFVMTTGDKPEQRELAIPGTERIVQAGYPDGSEPAWKFKVRTRVTLADWMTAPENPYFARAVVNRMWFYFFGRGLIEPVDDMVGGESTASHPELLHELAAEFASHGFDFKFLVRAMVASQAYQLSSARTHTSQDELRLFARRAMRGLSPEQLFDSVAQATGYRDRTDSGQGIVFGGQPSLREEFLTKFANQSDPAAGPATSILQALTLMNGRLVTAQTSLEKSQTLAAIVDAPFMNDEQRVDTLFLATMSRQPKPKEMERALRFLESARDDGNDPRKQALADLFWVLLNLGEFYLNH